MSRVSGCWLFLYLLLLCQQKDLCHKDVDTSQTWETLRASWVNPELCHQGGDTIGDTIRQHPRDPLNCVTIPGDTIGDTIRTRTPVTVESVQSELCHQKAVTQIGVCDTIGDTIKPTLTRGFTPLGELCHRMYCVTGVLGLQVFTTRKNSPYPYTCYYSVVITLTTHNTVDTIRRGRNRTKSIHQFD